MFGEVREQGLSSIFTLQYHLDVTIIMKIQFSFTNYLEGSTVGFCVMFVLPIGFPLTPCRDDTLNLPLSSVLASRILKSTVSH